MCKNVSTSMINNAEKKTVTAITQNASDPNLRYKRNETTSVIDVMSVLLFMIRRGCHLRLEAEQDFHGGIFHLPLSPRQVTPCTLILFAAI